MPVHCYGRPCDVEKIQNLADKYKLKIIYDAAHAFGVQDQKGSILEYGDLSVVSFHATKVFNTFEGGAVITRSTELKEKIDQIKNFGFINETTVSSIGINGKMSELNSVIGLCQLKYLNEHIRKRESVHNEYTKKLSKVQGIKLIKENNLIKDNYSYYPIRVTSNYRCTRDELYDELKKSGINSRRYFYPLISSFPMYKNLTSSSDENLPIANKIANEILCLPIYPDLSAVDQDRIVSILRSK
jgi:dTDP-4-amino-4,6-dideoxygalactose transaminase